MQTGVTGQLLKTQDRIVFLDTLRFIAAAAVVLQHSLERRCQTCGEAVAAFSPGVLGVVLFFMISGFVIPMTAEHKFDLRKFAIRRIFRIYPLVLVTFVIVAATGWFTGIFGYQPVRSASSGAWIANLLLVQDYFGVTPLHGVTWTLSLEFAWYAIFAIAFVMLGRKFDSWLIICAPIGIALLVFVSLWAGHRLPFGRIGMLYIAILGCRCYHYLKKRLDAKRLMLDIFVFLVVTVISNFVAFGYFSHPTMTFSEVVIPWIEAPVLFCLCCLIPKIRNSALLSNPTLAWLGSISFSIYLLHPIAISIADFYLPSSIAFVAGLAGTLVLSIIGHRLIELPGQDLGRRLTQRSGPPLHTPSMVHPE